METTPDHQNPTPWYKQFWPWFLIGLPATVIVACMFTIYLAISNPLNMVKQDYYKEGLSINQNIESERVAAHHNISASIDLIAKDSNVIVNIHSKFPATDQTYTLLFLHPLNSGKDFHLTLSGKSTTTHINPATMSLLLGETRWYIDLQPTTANENQANWLLKGELHPGESRSITLTPARES